MFTGRISEQLREHDGYRAIQALPGSGPILAAIFVAEIGDVTRFAVPERLYSWAGLTPRHYESDKVVHRGHITKQGSKLARWATVEAIQRKTTAKITADRMQTEARRGKSIAKIAAAQKLLTLIYFGLRDGLDPCDGQGCGVSCPDAVCACSSSSLAPASAWSLI